MFFSLPLPLGQKWDGQTNKVFYDNNNAAAPVPVCRWSMDGPLLSSLELDGWRQTRLAPEANPPQRNHHPFSHHKDNHTKKTKTQSKD